MSLLAALQAALAAEHAVLYGYGLVGAHLSGAERRRATAAYDVHRERRDLLETLVREAGGEPVAAAPAYQPPAPVTDRASALALAVRLEEGSAGAAYDLVGAAPPGAARTAGTAALTDAAVRAAGWRLVANPAGPATTAFPGRP